MKIALSLHFTRSTQTRLTNLHLSLHETHIINFFFQHSDTPKLPNSSHIWGKTLCISTWIPRRHSCEVRVQRCYTCAPSWKSIFAHANRYNHISLTIPKKLHGPEEDALKAFFPPLLSEPERKRRAPCVEPANGTVEVMAAGEMTNTHVGALTLTPADFLVECRGLAPGDTLGLLRR